MSKGTINNPPSVKGLTDHAYTGTKVALEMIPLWGAPIAALFETILTAPIDKRKQEWLSLLTEIVNELQNKVSGLTPEILANNEIFISAQLQAANIAIRTHYKERLIALKNAVKNSFLMDDIDSIKKMIFIRIIEDMTPLHFKLLHFLAFPNHYKSIADSKLSPNTYKSWGGPSEIWDESNMHIKSTDSLLEYVMADLNRFGLSKVAQLHEAPMYGSATQMGNDFIRFIQLEDVI